MASKFNTCVYADYFAEYSMRLCRHPNHKGCTEAPCRGCGLHVTRNSNLEKCHFCGSSNVSLYDEYGGGLDRVNWKVHCNKCKANGPTKNDAKEAKDAWNCRH